MTEVRSPQRQLMPDKADRGNHEPTFLRGIANKAKRRPDYRFKDLSRCLDKPLLVYCFRKLNRKSAPGVDKVTVEEYGKNLDANLNDLIGRLKRESYKAKLVRRKHIPKAPGKTRPLGIPAIEDKLVQTAVSALLSAIYEQAFYPFSYGYRPNRGGRDAVDDLTVRMQFGRFGYVVEADIKGFFNHLDHDVLLKMVAHRVDDKRFIRLINKWLKAGILEEDQSIQYPEEGTPQGGSISPVLANIYLHYVVDDWFQRVVKPRCQGDAVLCRYADDFVCGFQYQRDAVRFYNVLPKRLGKFNLQVAEDKTNILRFSRFAPGLKNRFTFLGFEFYWSTDKKGKSRLFKRTSRKKLKIVKAALKEYVKKHRHMKIPLLINKLNRKLQGHYNYFGVVGNLSALHVPYSCVVKALYKWLNRRSQRKSFTWDRLKSLLSVIQLKYPVVKYQPAKQQRVWW
ncbi:group II intron reverse transcriptase/maturase [Desulfoluna spongiiphila]|uniref:Group II intron reverse transcriptase/maturase n=1 Tax=Desulfoluna spongiiphila TaxID=419481 RepID=A0A1G5JP94_9BACT|nr:group II intron reverse transcriptase/maturase [Desulfoluna spongiiphila]SCY90147.1 group II intron reverse transcriptase/maturase [Desulfoluna spongiiphila]